MPFNKNKGLTTSQKHLEKLFLGSVIISIVIQKAFPFIRVVLHMFATAAHEVGHSIVYLLSGQLAVPTYSFVSHTGVTIPITQRYTIISLIIFGLIIFLCCRWRQLSGRFSIPVVLLTILFPIIFFIPTLREFTIIFMGQGGEVVVAFCLCYTAIRKDLDDQPYRKYILFFLGTYLFINTFFFAYNVTYDDLYKTTYFNRWDDNTNDFVQIMGLLKVPLSMPIILLVLMNITGIIFLFFTLGRYPYNIFSEIKDNIKQIFFLE